MMRLVLALTGFPAIIIGGVATYLWTSETGEKIRAYEVFRRNVNAIEHYSKLSKLELLKIHNEIVLNYKNITQYEDNIRTLIEEIRKNSVYDTDDTLFFRFENFVSAREEENEFSESFKTTSSLYRNSATNFAEQSEAVLLDLATRPRLDTESEKWLERYTALVRNLRAGISTSTGDYAGAPVLSGSDFAPPAEEASLADQALMHGERAMQLNEELRKIINETFSEFNAGAYLAILDYVDDRLESFGAEVADRKIYFAGCVILLCLMVLLAIGLLLRALRQLNQVNDSLEDRVTERTRELTEKSDELEDYKNDLEEQVNTRTKEYNRKAQELVTALIKEQQYSKLQKDFVSMISHEFRTPVAIIDMAAQRILRKKPENLAPDALTEFAQGIRKNAGRLTSLIDRTLTSSKFQEGRLDLAPSSLDLANLLTNICRQHEKLESATAIHVIVEPDCPQIKGDPEMLEQIFTNLIGNAIKYSPEKTPVVVRVMKEEDLVRIEIIDQGIGIPEAELPKLFQRYFRASNARVIAGTGLGLSITKEMIELHGGSLHVVTSENKGSAFITKLPIAGPQMESTVGEAEHDDAA